MDISEIGTSQMTPEVQAQYAVKLIKMAQQADAAVASILEDTVEFSNEAMAKYLSEVKK